MYITIRKFGVSKLKLKLLFNKGGIKLIKSDSIDNLKKVCTKNKQYNCL